MYKKISLHRLIFFAVFSSLRLLCIAKLFFIPRKSRGERSIPMARKKGYAAKKRTIDGIINEKISLLTDYAIVSKANRDKYTALFENELKGINDISVAQMKADRIALNYIEELFEL